MYLLLTTLALAALGQTPRSQSTIAVLPSVVGQGTDARSLRVEVLKEVSNALADRPQLRLLSDEEVFVLGGRILEDVSACGPDEACLAHHLRTLRARFGLIVVVNLLLDPPLVGLRMVDIDQRKTVADSAERVPASSTLGRTLRSAASEVFEQAGFRRGGRLAITVSPEDASLMLDDGIKRSPIPKDPLLPAGNYRIVASAEGYDDEVVRIDLREGEQVPLSIELSAKGSGLASSPWFWTAVGVVVVGGVATAVAASALRDGCVCAGGPGAVCDGC